jgi:hypothetical protein
MQHSNWKKCYEIYEQFPLLANASNFRTELVLIYDNKIFWYVGNYMQIHMAFFLVNQNLALSAIQSSLKPLNSNTSNRHWNGNDVEGTVLD